jgi:hypothetical protein
MRSKYANQSGKNYSLHGNPSADTEFTNTYQTQSTGNTSSYSPLSVGDIAYFRERQRNHVFEVVWLEFVNQAKNNGLTKKLIAERLGRHPSQITRWLSGPGNLELNSVSDLCLAMNCELIIGCSSLLGRPTPNYVHPAASEPVDGATWTVVAANPAPFNFGINGTTTEGFISNRTDDCGHGY